MKKILLIIGLCVPLVLSAQTKKFSEIVTDGDTITSAASTDFLYVIEDPLGTPASKAVRASAFATHQDISDSIAGLAGGHDAVTLAGSYDYITLTDQVITRGQVDLTTDVTGTLPDANVANDITISNISQVADITASAAEINTPLDGASVTLTEFQELESIGATTISANQWAALGGLPETVSGTELGYTDGVTSGIQAQLNAKVSNATHTGEVTGSTALTIANSVIEAVNLEATNSATDNYIPSYDAASGGFTWVENGSGGGWTPTGYGSVDAIETTLTDDDTNIPTSGAVVDYTAANYLATANLSPAASDLCFTSDTVFAAPYQIDTSLMIASYTYVLLNNLYGSDTVKIEAMNILVPGSTAPDVTFDVLWSTTGTTASATDLNTTPINVTSAGITNDVSFDNNLVPPGYIVIGLFTDITTKPDQSFVCTLFYSRQNRAY